MSFSWEGRAEVSASSGASERSGAAGMVKDSGASGWVGDGWIAGVLGRALPLLACVAVCLVAGWGIDRTLQELHLGWLNRLGGAVLAGGAGLILLAVLLGTAARVSPQVRAAADRSLLASRLVGVWERAVGPQAELAEASSETDADVGGSSVR